MDPVQLHHAVFGGVEEVVQEMLMPRGSVGGREGPHADCENVHVQKGDLSPDVEGRAEVKL